MKTRMFYPETSTEVFIIRILQFAKQQLLLQRATANLLIRLRPCFVPCTYSQKNTVGSVQQLFLNFLVPVFMESLPTENHTERVKRKTFEAWKLPLGLEESRMNAEIPDCH